MSTTTLVLEGKKYAIVPMNEYRRLLSGAAATRGEETGLPPLPKRMPSGNYPALEAFRVSIAREVVMRRKAAGLSQAELARRANIRPETLNRIEKARVMPDEATMAKLDKAMTDR